VIESLERVVARELARFGAVPGLAAIVEVWPEAVGPEIARNAWPARLTRDGTLVVHASSAAWAFELGQLEPRIRGLLPERGVAQLRFLVGPLPEPAAPAADARRPAPAAPSALELEAGAALAAAIQDDNLRRIVSKTAALSLARAASDRPL
jgi:hypothetical protein